MRKAEENSNYKNAKARIARLKEILQSVATAKSTPLSKVLYSPLTRSRTDTNLAREPKQEFQDEVSEMLDGKCVTSTPMKPKTDDWLVAK